MLRKFKLPKELQQDQSKFFNTFRIEGFITTKNIILGIYTFL
jgi:hypothetical protein